MPGAADSPSSVDRTLALLWRRTLGEPQGTRGPKQRVSVDEVVRTGIAIADADGLDAFSLRKVAERLGLGVMSLYTYVPGRSELIGLMVDEAAGEMAIEAHIGSVGSRLHRIARLQWEEYHRHPWLLQVDTTRPWIGPNGSDRYEWQLSALEGLGFTDLEMDQVVAVLVGLVESTARASVNARRARDASGITDAEWWDINAPVLERVMEAERYPVSGRVGQAAGQEYNAVTDPQRILTFGLDRLVDGLEALLAHRG